MNKLSHNIKSINLINNLINHIKPSRLETGYNPARSIEIDFLRGLALICIVLDHMQVSILKTFTLQNYTLFDATELFVFLSGFCVALAYNKIALKVDEKKAQKRFLIRSIELYGAFLLTVAFMLIIGYVCEKFQLDYSVVDTTQIDKFISNPLNYIERVLFFGQQPYFSSILPMYIVFCAASSGIIPMMSRYPVAVVITSFLIWLVSRHIIPNTMWSFNPCAWQFIFILGLFCYLFPVYAKLSLITQKKLAYVCLVLVILFGSFKIFTHFQFDGSDKLHLSYIRLLSFLSMAFVAFYYRSFIKIVAIRARWIQLIGQQSLPCFIASTVVSLAVNTLCEHLNYSLFREGVAADILAIASLYAVAKIFTHLKTK